MTPLPPPPPRPPLHPVPSDPWTDRAAEPSWYDDAPPRWWLDEPHDHLDDALVQHLVFLGGRLVDTWSERADHTPYAGLADRLRRDRERLLRPPLPPPPPPRPLWQQVREWLEVRVGGPAALDTLDDRPLDPAADDLLLPTTQAAAAVRERLELAADLVEHLAERHFDPELGTCLRRALVRVAAEEVSVVEEARSSAHLAGGVGWAVARANGLLGAQRDGGATVPVKHLQESLGLRSSPADVGRRVQRALLGLRTAGDERAPYGSGAPDLLPLGDPLLLTSATRARLVRLRERARAAQRAESPPTDPSAQPEVRAPGLEPEPSSRTEGGPWGQLPR